MYRYTANECWIVDTWCNVYSLSLSLSSFHKLRARLKGEPPSLLLLLLPHPLSPSCLRYEPQEDEYEMSHN